MINNLAYQAVFGPQKEKSRQKIRNLAKEKGIFLASTNNLYLARAKEEIPLNFTVPAINIRGMAYDIAQAVFQSANYVKAGAFIFEIARSEINYTNQSPEEYVVAIMAAALKSGFKGPLFIQADHYQIKPDQPKEKEIEKLKKLIRQSIAAGFYNIDIDASTLVDYSQRTIKDQQKNNYQITAQLAQYTRQIQPKGINISLGGEIGHIGGKNSTEEELRVFMEGFNSLFKDKTGLSKIAIQTGTHHGGVVLSNGKLAKVDVDFEVLKNLAQVARQYRMGGTVQHGASTLPDKYFSQFPKAQAIEVHLATGFQNIIFDHPLFPKELLSKIYLWLDENQSNERENLTSQQFHYKLRKKAWGQFKKEIWDLPKEIKGLIMDDLKKKFIFIFKALNIENSKEIIEYYASEVKPAYRQAGLKTPRR